jgi:two-component system, NarL family, response regulator DevR
MNIPSRPLRVYLVEDSPILVALLRDLLQAEPAAVVVGQAARAADAVAEIPALAPDVVIVDIALENSNGFDVLRTLSAHNGDLRPIKMVLSNFATQRYRDEALRLKADFFFDKNKQIVELVKTITEIARSVPKRNGSYR